MFSKLLIANRGEIAVRIIQTCKRMGITTAVVHSASDADSMHVKYADEAYALDGNTAAETYLNVGAIMDVVRKSGANAVHPGYGFLSESTLLVSALADSNTAFVGPSASVIEEMGSKISSRAIAHNAGVSGVPGTSAPLVSADEISEFAERVGYPVALKASYGGGGRGVRVVADAESAKQALESAKREALAYFGRDEVYIERYLERPRHVEVQILADSFGNIIHLGTRDCSVQRRHQKLIEEAPATTVSAELESRMGKAAIDIARAVGYVNAGTMEFLVEDGQFYFLEMNTRLQVEHPVTEMVTGVDIVEQQLRIAAGERLSLTQDDIVLRGHAIELRINAEDPAGGRFTPTPGTITEMVVPAGAGVRFDAGYETGNSVSEYFDGLVGKLVVHAANRADAVVAAQIALKDMVVLGIATTAPAQQIVLDHPDFVADEHYTRWLEEQVVIPERFDTVDNHDRSIVAVAGRTFWIPQHTGANGSAPENTAGSASTPPSSMLTTRATAERTDVAGDGLVRSPMQGTVLDVLVQVGAVVSPDDVVCVVEAMKMENRVRAAARGTVTTVTCSPGSAVAPGDVLVTIDADTPRT
ncbi:carbamoyl phosphate synthase [Rhodococcus sp. 15-1154-1]|nr:biotin carboxylase N-terminal domain-containing protein [Rhodococcus sp. 15-1154-1]OZF02513.1 carbamoyl phosphate synthase [Rhodococcus sp. 15-1154-1]